MFILAYLDILKETVFIIITKNMDVDKETFIMEIQNALIVKGICQTLI